ncbi:MAG: hypothetical protein A2X17_07715 [Bacteroidetes bacterium GWF2_41_61]|nr:MAG: hypothetical protein A2X20_12045 [Bacteroidetes bacterium GWE2_40_15]OFY30082.1 MAG: hypothetical protein A2X17_07715 [Bacteroidetes bacterium GWF2_41_61]OFY91757.1 MAG: hypothetical protein A2266_07755 [Bacteroidetes bacterium RIFOXYA12_FULL_40_10]HBG23614.1 hypothetical protein [Rikenellaceae bacterium]HBZ25000.1 hypothetical protein [Rikenellaceae bacterium]
MINNQAFNKNRYRMKTFLQFFLISLILAICCTCSKDEGGVGTIQFRMVNPVATKSQSNLQKALSNPQINSLQAPYVNPDLTGDVTQTTMVTLKFCVGDVWVSTGEVKAGGTDNLTWVRLTTTTNQELKNFEDYTFPPVEIPAGTYKSIKITFKNRFYRVVTLNSNPTVKYELLETMGSFDDPCNDNDESWVDPNYFTEQGNHKIVGGVFKVVSPGEKLRGFSIESGKTVTLNWRLGAGVTEPCTNALLDLNKNRRWDCGTDDITIICPPSVEFMWDFVVN